jgi:polysaccharide export outer membrane protein
MAIAAAWIGFGCASLRGGDPAEQEAEAPVEATAAPESAPADSDEAVAVDGAIAAPESIQPKIEIPPYEIAGTGARGTREYEIGPEDELEISVYGHDTLATRQRVRPDGRIGFPIVGDVEASGKTPTELRDVITRGLSRYLANPQVTVVVTSYRSRHVNVLGEVRTPGVIVLDSDATLLHTLAIAGGVTAKADLHSAVVVRDGVALPISIERLVQQHDFTQNVVLEPYDTILIPDASVRRALVIGEVKVPSVVMLKDDITVLEAITRAQGFSRQASRGNVVLVRAGQAVPEVLKVDAKDVLSGEALALNYPLENGDIVFVPKSAWQTTVDLFRDISSILSPAIMAETGVILGPNFWKVLQGNGGDAGTGVVVTP